MKKLIFSCAVLLMAGVFASCDNKNKEKCFEVTMSYNFFGFPFSMTSYLWCSEAALDADIQNLKNQQIEQGVPEDFIKIETKPVNKSRADCH